MENTKLTNYDCCNFPISIDRPGGYEITDKGVSLCNFPKGGKIADIGCGSGHTLRYLSEKYGYSMIGVDIDTSRVTEKGNFQIITADSKDLPFGDCSFDGLIFECSMSKMEDPNSVIGECARILKHGGKLMISDLYARKKAAQLYGRLGRIEERSAIENRCNAFGFRLLEFIDYSNKLIDMWANLIFEKGRNALCIEFGADALILKEIKCGYYLAVYKKI